MTLQKLSIRGARRFPWPAMTRLIWLAVLIIGCAAPQPQPLLTPSAAPGHTPLASASPTPGAEAQPATLAPSPPSATPAREARPPSRVVIISVDGLRPDGLLQSGAPHILALASQGAFTWAAQTVIPSATLPAHASMLSGYSPRGHGIVWNDNAPGRGTIRTPTVLSIARQAGLRTVMVVGKEKLAQLNAPGSVDAYVYATRGDQQVADEAVAQIQSGFDLMFIHLPNVDFFGHSTGWMSPVYLAEIANTDLAVGRIVAALPENTTVILTADHGGHGTVHGSRLPEDMTIPWIIAGPDTAAGHELASGVNVIDTAATAALILGLSLPPDVPSQPVFEAFGLAAPDLLGGSWREARAQARGRSEMPGAVLNGLIYVPGGFGGEADFQAYDPAADAWIDLAPLPAGRHHLMSAAAGERIYVFGGAAAGSWQATSDVFAYDPARNTWEVKASMPEPRMSGAAVSRGETIYIVGGTEGTGRLLEYDSQSDSWRTRAALGQPREHLAAAALDGQVYALGGRWAGIGELASVEVYDPSADAWRAGPSMLRPRSGFGAAVLAGRIVVAGGEIVFSGSETLSSTSVWDPRSDAWASGRDMPGALHGLAMAAVGGRLYVLGGSSRAGAIENAGRVYVYDP